MARFLVTGCAGFIGSHLTEKLLDDGYDYPGPRFVYPATKSDGKGTGVSAVPEGTRFQLNPRLSEAQIVGWAVGGRV
ncbi:MAG: GDP-mannose 4,6-dehydratase [Actinomycetota bacterium]|nr:GDP-mannose 4,6-dehydratase [Actinomycetota bacterium]